MANSKFKVVRGGGGAYLDPKIKGGPGIISWPCGLQFGLNTKVRDWGCRPFP